MINLGTSMNLKWFYPFMVFCGFFISCNNNGCRDCQGDQNPELLCSGQNEYLVGATLYNQQSGEYKALAFQAFGIAKLRLDDTLSRLRDYISNIKDSATKLKVRALSLAVIVDLDETILDNSGFEGHLIKVNGSFQDNWRSYISQMRAKAAPGALTFLQYVDECFTKYGLKNKIAIFYVTNRDSTEMQATARNLANLGFPQIDPDNLKNDINLMVMRNRMDSPDSGNKQKRFDEIRKKDTVLLQLGDNLNDFSGSFYGLNDSMRCAGVDLRKARFGKNYIVLPNPMYGDWITGLPPRKDASPDVMRRMDLKDY